MRERMEIRINITKKRFHVLVLLFAFAIGLIIFGSAATSPTKPYHPVQQVTKQLDPVATNDFTSIDNDGDGIVDLAENLTSSAWSSIPEIAVRSAGFTNYTSDIRSTFQTPRYPSGVQALTSECHFIFSPRGLQFYDETHGGGPKDIGYNVTIIDSTTFELHIGKGDKKYGGMNNYGAYYTILCVK